MKVAPDLAHRLSEAEARYVAISDLFYRDGSAIIEVLDLASQSVVQATARRSLFERKFGVSRNGTIAPPQAEVVLYRDGIVGLAVASGARGGFQRYSYAELDSRTMPTQNITRSPATKLRSRKIPGVMNGFSAVNR